MTLKTKILRFNPFLVTLGKFDHISIIEYSWIWITWAAKFQACFLGLCIINSYDIEQMLEDGFSIQQFTIMLIDTYWDFQILPCQNGLGRYHPELCQDGHIWLGQFLGCASRYKYVPTSMPQKLYHAKKLLASYFSMKWQSLCRWSSSIDYWVFQKNHN